MSKKRSIIYVSHLHPPEGRPLESLGGIQTVSLKLIENLAQHSELRIIPWINEVTWRGIEWSTARFLWKSFWKLPELIQSEKPDLVLFTSMVTASLSPWIKYRGIQTPLLALSHGHDVTLDVNLYQRYLPKVFANLDGVVSVSRATQQETLRRGLDPLKSHIVHNGIDSSYEARLPDLQSALKKLPIGREKPLLLTVGRLVKRKGHRWFLESVLPLVQTPMHYLIIGEGPEEPAISKVADQINAQGRHRVIMMGRQEQEVLDAAYRAADLFIMPNIPVAGDMEGFGVVLLEANLAATPAIVSDLEGMKDVIENGVNGFRIQAGNQEAFAQKIDEFLATGSEKKLLQLTQKSVQHVRHHFFWNKIVDHYVEVVDKTIQRSLLESI